MSVFTEMEQRLLTIMNEKGGIIERSEVEALAGINYHTAVNLVRRLKVAELIVSVRHVRGRTLYTAEKAREEGVVNTENAGPNGPDKDDVPVIERQNLINSLWRPYVPLGN